MKATATLSTTPSDDALAVCTRRAALQRGLGLAGVVAGASVWPQASAADNVSAVRASASVNTAAQLPGGAAGKVWRLAVVPQLTPVEMTRAWSPIVDALGAAGVRCGLVVYPSIAQFEPEFLQGRADVLYLNPYHMVMAHHSQQYVPLLRDTRPLEGVLVVKADSSITRIEQLKNQRISFPAPNAFAASLYPRSVLDRQYHLPFETHYAQNHRNAIRMVLLGDSAAAGVVRTTLEKEPADVQAQLRVVYATPALSAHPLAVHPRVPEDVRAQLLHTLQNLAAAPASNPLMAAIQMPNPMLANYTKDYAPLEQLNIEQYVVTE